MVETQYSFAETSVVAKLENNLHGERARRIKL